MDDDGLTIEGAETLRATAEILRDPDATLEERDEAAAVLLSTFHLEVWVHVEEFEGGDD